MKIRGMVISAVMILSLATSAAFAAPGEIRQKNEDARKQEEWQKRHSEFEKDPIKALEAKKQEIAKRLKEGKITKEEAERKLTKIDGIISEIKEFNKLSINDKKKKLIKDCEARLNMMMESGRIDQKEAERIFKDYVDKINNWDGSGYPMMEKGLRGKHR